MKITEFCEILGDIDDKYIEEARQYHKAKKRKAAKAEYFAAAACIAVIAAAGYIFSLPYIKNPNFNEKVNPDDSIYLQNDNESGKIDDKTEEKNSISVNKVENIGSADMDVKYSYYEKIPYDVWLMVLDDFYNFTGISYEDFTSSIPASWTENSFYSALVRYYKENELQEYGVHDYIFEYQNDDGGEARIAISPEGKPLRDLYILCDDPVLSEINGTELIIYGYEDMYFTEFSYNGLNYDIETNGVQLEALEELLESIIK